MAQGGRGWFHRKRRQPEPEQPTTGTTQARSLAAQEVQSNTSTPPATAPSVGAVDQTQWSPEARSTPQPPQTSAVSPPSSPASESPSWPPAPAGASSAGGTQPAADAPGTSTSSAPEQATPTGAESRTAAPMPSGEDHLNSAYDPSSPVEPARDGATSSASSAQEHAPVHVGVGAPTPPPTSTWPTPSRSDPTASSSTTGSYDWDAATAAALSDEPATPDAVTAPHHHTPTPADRLLEDIIREIVGDAAAETVFSLQPERPTAARRDSTAATQGDAAVPAAQGAGLARVPQPEPVPKSLETPPSASTTDASETSAGRTELPSTTSLSAAAVALEGADAAVSASAPADPTSTSPGPEFGATDDSLKTRSTADVTEPRLPSSETITTTEGHGPSPATSSLVERVPTDRGNDDAIAPRFEPGSSEMTAAPIPSVSAGVSRETTTPAPEAPVSRETVTRHGGTPLADQLADETRRRLALEEEDLPLPASTRILTISNQKGGVGKTTTAVNLSAALARTGAHVLVIDLDPQGNASTALGVDHRSEDQSVYDVLVSDLPLSDVVRPSTEHEHLDCVPATIHLAGAEIELVSLVAREQRLRRALDTHLASMDRPYDYVFIDCPPSLGLLTINAFVAAREVLIPIQCEYYALEGLSQLLSNIELIEKHLNADLRLSTILLTMYDSRTNLAQQVAQEVRDHFPIQTLDTIIPRSVRVSEAPSYGQSVISYDYASSGSLSYREAAAEIARRGAATQKDTN